MVFTKTTKKDFITTGTLIMGETALPIKRMKSGPLGGDQQIGTMLANGELDLIIFLRDPLTAQPHEPDVSALLRLCDVQEIPLATNVLRRNALKLILKSPRDVRQNTSWIKIRDF